MLTDEAAPLLSPRREIIGATERGLTVDHGGDRELVPWSSVKAVYAAHGKFSEHSERRGLLLAFHLFISAEECALLVLEGEPVWVALTAILPDVFPGLAPFEIWGVEALTASTPLILYARPERLS